MEGINACSKRETAGNEVMATLDRVTGLAEKVAARAGSQLHAVCTEERPTNEKCGVAAIERDYPPMFSEFRDRLRSIENSLMRVDRVLDRCEV